MRSSIRSKDGQQSLCAVSLKKLRHFTKFKAQLWTLKLAKTGHQESSTLEKEGKRLNVDKSTHQWENLVTPFLIVSNSFTSLSFQERPRDFGEETSSHLEIYARKLLTYLN